MEVHRGEGGIRIGAEELVVASDDGHILREGEAHFLQLLHDAQGDQVVEGDDGGGPAVPVQAGEHPQHGALAAFHIISGVHVVGGIVRQVHHAELLQEADAAAGGILAVHGAAQEGDAPVAQRMQVPDRQTGAVDQVALDADAVQGDVRRADGGDGHVFAELFQGGVQVAPVLGPDASGKEHAVHPAADELTDDLGGDGLVFHRLEQAEAAAVLFRLPPGGVKDPVEIQVGYYGKHNRQGAAAAALQVLGGDAGGVGVGVDDLLHLQAGGFLYMRVLPDDARDGGGGDAGFPGNVVDGGFLCHAVFLRWE